MSGEPAGATEATRSVDLPPPVTAGTRVVHIGFPKTGTTSLQSALELKRPELLEHGVLYPGTHRYQKFPAVALVGATPRIGEPRPDISEWTNLVHEVRRADQSRVMVSSEWLSEADDEAVKTLANDLGDVQIVATLRPLSKILPAAWQQYVQNGMRTTYANWLNGMLLKAPYRSPTPSFWRRQRHDVILTRWASVVGPERVLVIVVDETERTKLLRQFECLLDLPSGLLPMPERQNRSLSANEVELLRQLNDAWKSSEEDWPDEMYRRVIRLGIAERFGRSPQDAQGSPLVTPQWALDRAAEIGGEIVQALRDTGVRVIGDVDGLAARDTAREEAPSSDLPADVVAVALRGAINAARRYGVEEGRQAGQTAVGNLRRRGRRVVRRLRGRVGPSGG